MPLQLLRKLSPRRRSLTDRWFLRPFGALLHDPALWRLDRHGAAKAVAVGVFVAWLPIIPLHMAAAALIALLIRVHLPLSILMVWLSNPVTALPMYYAAFRVGLLFINDGSYWLPLIIGSLLLGALSALLGYFALDLLWHWTLVRKYHRIRDASRRRAEREQSNPD